MIQREYPLVPSNSDRIVAMFKFVLSCFLSCVARILVGS